MFRASFPFSSESPSERAVTGLLGRSGGKNREENRRQVSRFSRKGRYVWCHDNLSFPVWIPETNTLKRSSKRRWPFRARRSALPTSTAPAPGTWIPRCPSAARIPGKCGTTARPFPSPRKMPRPAPSACASTASPSHRTQAVPLLRGCGDYTDSRERAIRSLLISPHSCPSSPPEFKRCNRGSVWRKWEMGGNVLGVLATADDETHRITLC
jgi:hypothetical protein